MRIMLLKYNNYFNRKVKRPNNPSNPLSYESATLNYKIFNDINFNYNDGINSSQIVNWSENFSPDYLLVLSNTSTSFPFGQVESRWFIIDSSKTRGKQFKMTLRRDLLVDYYSSIVEAPCYIEKGVCDLTNILICNKESLAVNQIKQSEELLKDGSGCGWYIAYLAKNLSDDQHQNEFVIKAGEPNDYISVDPDFPWYDLRDQELKFYIPDTENNVQIDYSLPGYNNLLVYFRCFLESYVYEDFITSGIQTTSELRATQTNQGQRIFGEMDESERAEYNERILYAFLTEKGLYSYNELQDLKQYNHKIIKKGGNFYEVSVDRIGSYRRENSSTVGYTSLHNIMKELLEMGDFTNPEAIDGNNCTLYHVEATYTVSFRLLTELDKTITIPIERTKTDATYDIIAIPQAGLNVASTGAYFTTVDGLSIINAMATQLSSFIYDIQLLPYCPIPSICSNNEISVSNLTSYDYNLILDDDNNPISLMLYPVSPKFTLNINKSITVPTDPLEFKVEHESSFIRLVSPNYNGQFEMSATANNGIDYFKVDCLYQPNIPYIHVSPNFKGLYGSDFNDCRGLICSGDFSLPRIDDKFIDYQIQNKNYENLFNRSIENMEFNRQEQKKAETWSMISGAITGAYSGAVSGSLAGGPIGAAIGGVGAAITNVVGGALDMAASNRQYKESLDYAKDRFNMSIENIQALPYSITKLNPLTNNNKVFPFVEFYSCNDIEKQAIEAKLKFDGFTIGIIDKIKNYNNGYIKGSLLRIDDLSEDTHLFNEISNEIAKGVYYVWD